VVRPVNGRRSLEDASGSPTCVDHKGLLPLSRAFFIVTWKESC